MVRGEREGLGTWSEQVVVSEDKVIPAPQGVDLEIVSAMMNSAGIAYRLLADFAELKPGDFVLQNDASSPVGMAVIQLCKKRGIKTINIVKDSVGAECVWDVAARYFGDVPSSGVDRRRRDRAGEPGERHGLQEDHGGPAGAEAGAERSRRRGDDEHVPSDEVGAARGIERRDATVVTYNESSYEAVPLAAELPDEQQPVSEGLQHERVAERGDEERRVEDGGGSGCHGACRRPPSVPEEGQVLAGRRRRGRRFLACC